MSEKTMGQYMTPVRIVKMILDSIGYTGKELLSKKIFEPSFGTGNFLVEIVSRIIEYSKKEGKSESDICFLIKQNVFGVEKDEELYGEAISRLNSLLESENIEKIDWSENLICGDTLSEYERFAGSMDYVVGNPPFVRIHNLDEVTMQQRDKFKFSSGMTDMYVIFYEIGIRLLNKTGKIGYISPNSFIRNSSQKKFREYLVKNNYVSAIYDFKQSKLFCNADTYTCICILDMDKKAKDFVYREYSMYEMLFENKLSVEYLNQYLSSTDNIKFLDANAALPCKLPDIAVVQNGISTNLDSVYVIKAFSDAELQNEYTEKTSLHDNRTLYFKDKKEKIRKIESAILRRCVKESRYEGTIGNTYIIFPYRNNKPLTEKEIKKEYPKAFAYLYSFKEDLEKRNMEKNVEWFLYARSQGLKNIDKKKIIFKHIMKKDIKNIELHILDEDVVVYSGLYIIAKEGYGIDYLHSVLHSEDFAKYCILTGYDKSSGYISVSSNILKKFGVEKKAPH